MFRLKEHPAAQLLLSLGLVFGIGLIDYKTGTEASLLFLYLIPILHATWFLSPLSGTIVSLASGTVWFFANHVLVNTADLLAVSLWNTAVRLSVFLLIVYIFGMQAALKRALNKEKELARTDALTGVFNSRAFAEVATHEIERARRYGKPISIAYIDLDNFKTVNDTLGHSSGDSLLRNTALSLRQSTRATDTVARLGGDEFAILLPETSASGAQAVITKCRQLLLTSIEEKGWPVSASIGLATFVTPPESYESLIHQSDELMYEAKTSGKNCIISKVIGQGKDSG